MVDEFAPKGPVEQARMDVANALVIASRKLEQAIKNRDHNAPLPMDVYNAYAASSICSRYLHRHLSSLVCRHTDAGAKGTPRAPELLSNPHHQGFHGPQ
jgi:hypothetical protein